MTWLKSTALAVTLLVSLSACDLMRPVKETNAKMDHMLAEMQRMSGEMFSLHFDEKLSGAAANFRLTGEDHIRIRALHIFFETGDLSTVLWQYVATPRPIFSDDHGPIYDYDSPASIQDDDLKFSYPNVMYVHGGTLWHRIDDPDSNIPIYYRAFNTVEPDFARILSFAVHSAVELIQILHKQGYETPEDEKKNKERARRIFHIGTVVEGGRKIPGKITNEDGAEEVLVENFTMTSKALDRAKQKEFVKTEGERIYYANALREMLEKLGMHSQFPTLASLVETRMGLSKNQWNYPNP